MLICINKKAQRGDNSGLIIAIIAAVVITVLVLYFLAQLAIWIGVAGLIVAVILFFTGNHEFGIIILIVSIILLAFGFGVTHFFESNPTGRVLLDGANVAVNTTKEGYNAYNQALGGLK
ncbi:hypothetical protein HYV81_05325 [Candidatus Woesearchaeota archaeon]|nr:hypothetical protein [Candidatus Woesearchaeota archaeon]